MKHFFRSHLVPSDVLVTADRFFPTLGFSTTATASRSRTFIGPLGTMRLGVKPEGGHCTFVEADTDQMGESRMDRNVKKFFLMLHRTEDPAHTVEAAY
jgi:hypothetical protein